MTATTVTVTIGKRSQEYTLVSTTAPIDYDYGGTLELYDGGRGFPRYILVPTQGLTAQRGRNGSGLYTFEPTDDITEDDLAERLFTRVVTKGESE